MHELSIATSILKTAENEVEKAEGNEVKEITLSIGKLAGVELNSLTFIWDQCMKNTVLENATLLINEPQGIAKCAECNTEYSMEKIYDSCPNCGSYFKDIISGKELKINKLIIT